MHGVRYTTVDDVLEVFTNIRPEDEREVRSAAGMSSLRALYAGWKASEQCYTMFVDDDVLGIFGVTVGGGIWMLGTNVMEKHQITFLRECRGWIGRLHQTYPRLWAFADARNDVHINWLHWMGFVFLRCHEKYGFDQIPFWEVEHR